MKASRRRRWGRIAALILLAAVVLLAGVVWAQVWLMTTPIRDRHLELPISMNVQDVTLITADGLKLSGWYVAGSRPEGMILAHGVNANRAYLVPQADVLFELGYHVLMFDLRGHGRSQGHLLTYGYSEALDVRAAADYLLAVPGVRRVAAIGHSLGGAAVVRAAAEDDRLQAIVIQSSYSSLPQAIQDNFDGFSILPRRPFLPLIVALSEARLGFQIAQVDSTRDLAQMSPRPVLVIHSDSDTMFPLRHAQEMYEAAQGDKELWVVSGLPHVNPITGNEAEYYRRIRNFLEAAWK